MISQPKGAKKMDKTQYCIDCSHFIPKKELTEEDRRVGAYYINEPKNNCAVFLDLVTKEALPCEDKREEGNAICLDYLAKREELNQ
jgi:hypothetical protein